MASGNECRELDRPELTGLLCLPIVNSIRFTAMANPSLDYYKVLRDNLDEKERQSG
jgi:hypothetical protein